MGGRSNPIRILPPHYDAVKGYLWDKLRLARRGRTRKHLEGWSSLSLLVAINGLQSAMTLDGPVSGSTTLVVTDVCRLLNTTRYRGLEESRAGWRYINRIGAFSVMKLVGSTRDRNTLSAQSGTNFPVEFDAGGSRLYSHLCDYGSFGDQPRSF